MSNGYGGAALWGRRRRPVEAGLSAIAQPPTIDDMLREAKEKLMRYGEWHRVKKSTKKR
ncbi:hypothetical protein [Burkholderia anthinoferrum]|uniref:Uncharacterized protein n=1 Tax=Burkholderia anthinoferrum TaxID=3090833 RepID=A0ABU5WY07_9BURK|nr:hypothetical protein [Burkholderia anthinoferrum]MEB2583665.1 hypothetical protein [Burkholderia anthinoferrum]